MKYEKSRNRTIVKQIIKHQQENKIVVKGQEIWLVQDIAVPRKRLVQAAAADVKLGCNSCTRITLASQQDDDVY